MNVVEKSVDAAVNPVESEHPNGEFEVILSTEDLDRDKENLWIDEWEQPLPDKIHIDGDHGRTLEKTVGSAVPVIEGDKLIGKGIYAGTPYAQMVRQLVNEGHINSVSVTFSEKKDQKDNSVRRELLNAAFVAIPANPKAVVVSSKAKKDEKDDGKDDKPYGDVEYADPKNGKYPIDTAEHVRSAWSFINRPKDADEYSAEELAEVKDRIKKAAKKFDIEIDDEKSLSDGIETPSEIREEFDLDKTDAVDKDGFEASGNNPTVDPDTTHDDHVQAIHDAAQQLGAQCYNYADADPGIADGGNKSYRLGEGGVAIQTLGSKEAASVLAHVGMRSRLFTGQELQDGIVLKWINSETANKSAEPPQGPTDIRVINKDANKLLAGLDAVLDQAVQLTKDVDRKGLPEPVAQGLDLLLAAHHACGSLMVDMDVFDPDAKSSSKSAGSPKESAEESAVPAAAEKSAAAETADESADDTASKAKAAEMKSRALAFLIKQNV